MRADKASSFLAVSEKRSKYIRPRCLFYQVSISVLVGLYGICKGYRGLKVIYGFKEKRYACEIASNFLAVHIAETKQLYSTSMPSYFKLISVLLARYAICNSYDLRVVHYHYCLN